MVAVVAAVLLAGVVAQRMATPPSARVVRSVQLTFTGQVTFPSLEAAFFPALATDGAARLLHADQHATAHARTVLSGRRRGRHHPNAVQARVPPERLAGRIAAAGPRLRPGRVGRRSLGGSRRGRRTASPRCGRSPRRRLVARREAYRLCPPRGVVRGRQRREQSANARDHARPRVLGALVPGRRALAIHGRESAGEHAVALGSLGRGSRPAAGAAGPWRARRGLLRRVESGRAAFLLQPVP